MQVLAVIGGIMVMYFTYKLIFGCWEELSGALTFWLTPDVFSWLRGEAMDDFFAEMKLVFWVLSGVATYFGLLKLFG